MNLVVRFELKKGMASSDDEAEAVPQSVSNYHFVDDKEEPISFHVLPIQWSDSERQDGKKVQLYLHGYADNGLEKICKPVIAWKFDLSNVKPEISVLLKVNRWMVLQKPRKSYEEIIRSILITVQCLSYVKRNPEAFGKSMWDHLSKAFRYLSEFKHLLCLSTLLGFLAQSLTYALNFAACMRSGLPRLIWWITRI